MSYQPKKAIHPGKTVARALEEMGKTQKWLAEHAGISEKQISEIINGNAPITPETALRFENALGGSARFWMNLDSNYRETLALLAAEEKAREEIHLLCLYPVAELVKLGFVEKIRDKIGQVRALWQFFGVSSLTLVPTTEAVAYRRWSGGKKTNQHALAAWLRCGEIESGKTKRPPFDINKLKTKLPELRTLSADLSPDIANKIDKVLSECGVAFAAIPHFKGTYANGSCRWIGDTPVIQLSLRGKKADTFFFTLFHELGHLLLHGKREAFVSVENATEGDEKEQAADTFAQEVLLPSERWSKFLDSKRFDRQSILGFAKSESIDPGIVVGRLKWEKRIRYTCHTDLHKKLT